MLEEQESPFRKAMVVACSQSGRLIEVDVLTGADPSRAVMWNAWRPGPQRSHKRKRRSRFTSSSRPRNAASLEPWLTGVTAGPPAWEEPRRAAAAAAAAATSAVATEQEAAQAAAAAAPGVPHPTFRPVGPTLYACCYSVPGVVAFDATTLLPLGVLIAFGSEHLAAPEGICASHDNLFVANCLNGTIARIGLQMPAPTAAAAGGAAAQRRHARYGGALPYGQGVVLATIVAADGWVAWGLALSPDARALYCAVDLPYNVPKGRSYTQAPPPNTTGSMLCVPLECLGLGTAAAAAAPVAGDGSLQAVADAVPPHQQHQQQVQALAPPPPPGQVQGPGVRHPAAPFGVTIAPYHFTRGEVVLRRPCGLCFSPDGGSLWVTSYDSGIVELAGPARGALAGTVLRLVPLPLPPPLPAPALAAAQRGPLSARRRGVAAEGSAKGKAGSRPRRSGRRGAGAGGEATGSGQSRNDPRVMLPWDLCWVPQGPPPRCCLGPSASGYAGRGGSGDMARGVAAPPPLLCVTLHEDPSKRESAPSGAECRAGVLDVARASEGGCSAWAGGRTGARIRSWEGLGEGQQGGVPAGVDVRVRWRATRERSHPGMTCVA